MSPTYDATTRFLREFLKLPASQRHAFLAARDEFIEALRTSPPEFPTHLRIKRVQGTDGIWELTFAADGRTTFRYGDEVIPGQPHIVWLRIGKHAILDDPAG